MITILSIVGARPQFIKAATVSRALRQRHREVLLHTGQHYDYGMSEQFFQELTIPAPDINLNVGSGPHGAQTAAMLEGIERALLQKKPDRVLVYGDTNSTLAGALAAAKLNIPVAHVEAGLRSFDRQMPEEINRVVTDHLSTQLFCPTPTAAHNLAQEDIRRGVYIVGDVMYDAALYYGQLAASQSTILARLALSPQGYLLATVHRAANTDHVERLRAIMDAFARIDAPIVLPLHPRTRQAIRRAEIVLACNVRAIEPVGYLDMIVLERNARLILTDSGGVQKEAYFYAVPCVTLRPETEWVETVHSGWNVLVDADREAIVRAAQTAAAPPTHPEYYGDGRAGERIAELLIDQPASQRLWSDDLR